MKFRIVSDIHAEFWGHGGVEKHKKFSRILEAILPPLEDDKDTVLLLAGDFCDISKMTRFEFLLRTLRERFRDVIYCIGNHETYTGDYVESYRDIIVPMLDDVGIRHGLTHVYDDIVVITSTLWTDYNKGNPIDMVVAETEMNDFNWITYEGRQMKAEDLYLEHKQAVANILEAFNDHKGKKCIVMTHHAPHHNSITDRFKNSTINSAYASDLSELIMHFNPLYWFHGHIHDTVDYVIGSTRIMSNPYGYHTVERNKKYNPHLVVEL